MRISRVTPNEQDALIIIDVQNDFCGNGALAVPNGEQVVSVINDLGNKFQTCLLYTSDAADE